MKALRSVLGVCVATLTLSGTASAGIMQTGCQSTGAGDPAALMYVVALNLVQSIIAIL